MSVQVDGDVILAFGSAEKFAFPMESSVFMTSINMPVDVFFFLRVERLHTLTVLVWVHGVGIILCNVFWNSIFLKLCPCLPSQFSYF